MKRRMGPAVLVSSAAASREDSVRVVAVFMQHQRLIVDTEFGAREDPAITPPLRMSTRDIDASCSGSVEKNRMPRPSPPRASRKGRRPPCSRAWIHAGCRSQPTPAPPRQVQPFRQQGLLLIAAAQRPKQRLRPRRTWPGNQR